MPSGGFGNLIALPLQLNARHKGFSLFVDEQLMPHADQWGFLANIKRFSLNQVLKLTGSYQPASTKEAFELTDPWNTTTKPSLNSVIPRYISCAHVENGYLSLPRGCLDDVLSLLTNQNPKFTRLCS